MVLIDIIDGWLHGEAAQFRSHIRRFKSQQQHIHDNRTFTNEQQCRKQCVRE